MKATNGNMGATEVNEKAGHRPAFFFGANFGKNGSDESNEQDHEGHDEMKGETDLTTLLKNMSPKADGRRFVFCTVSEADLEHLIPTGNTLPTGAIGIFREAEGITVILEAHVADELGLAYEGVWALITLTIHSDLAAVGFLAAITTRLAAAAIPVDPVSAFHHDHLFVPHDRADEAIVILNELSK